MDTLKSTIIEILKKESCANFAISSFMNHIVIKISEEEDFEHCFKKINEDVVSCISSKLPERAEDVLIDVTNGEQDRTFRVRKNNIVSAE